MSPSAVSCNRPLQRYPNVEKRVSLGLSPASRVVSMNSCFSSSVASGAAGSLSRGTSTGDTFSPPTEESFLDVKVNPPPGSQQHEEANSTPASTKRHGVFLSPSNQLSSTSRANPTKPVGTTLYDPGPVSPVPSPTRSKGRNYAAPTHSSSPRSAGELPVTPIRRRTAKELIDHFERSGGSAPRTAPAMKLSATAPIGSTPRTPLSEARLNGPLPALPLKEPSTHWQPSSPGRSPIRSLMNMVGLGKKGNGDTRWKGRRKGSVSPTPPPKRARALLAEDDEAPIPPRRSFDREAEYGLNFDRSNEDRLDAVTIKTVSDDHATPVRDIPIFLGDKPGDEESPILRAGPLLYLTSSTPEVWCNTQAVLQAPNLSLSDPQPPPASQQRPSTSSAFRSFALRYCAVESLPCVILDGPAASPLGLCSPSPLIIGPRDIALYVFEISFPDPSPGTKGKKERFATTSAWDRGKWVCHIWDAICSANVSLKYPQDSIPASEMLPVVAAKTNDWNADHSDTDLATQRLQPPLRVVNVSKLSAFYDINTIGAGKATRLSSDESGRLTTEMPPNDTSAPSIVPFNWPLAPSSTNAPPFSSRFNTPLRSAPLQKPSPYGSVQTPVSKEELPRSDRTLKTRSRSVPCSPSINNLGKMTLVQQRLARFESTKEGTANSTNMETRGRSPRPLPIQSVAPAPSKPTASDTGLSTPPISPTNAMIHQRGVAANRAAPAPISFSRFPVRTVHEPASSSIDPKLVPIPAVNSMAGEPSSSRSILQFSLGAQTENVDSTWSATLDKTNLSQERDTMVQTIDSPAPSSLDDSVTRCQSAATTSTARAHRLSGLTSIPGSEYPDIAPLFSLVRDTALEQATQVKALMEELETLRTEIRQASVEPLAVNQDGKDIALQAVGREERSGETDELSSTLDSMRSQLSSITTELRNLAPAQSSDENRNSRAELHEILTRHSQQLTEMHDKVLQLDAIKATLGAMNEASCADRASWTQKLDGVAGGIAALKLDGVHDRLDSIRASLAVLEAIAQSQQTASTSIGPISAFRNASKSPATDSNGSMDLSPIHEKLDALAQRQYGPTDEVLTGLQEQVQSLAELCSKLLANTENTSSETVDDVPPGGERAPQPQISKLLEHLKEDRTDQEKYFTDLNSWLQVNATQTSSQYHTISTALQQVSQALAPLAAEDGSSDTPEVPGSDAEPRQTQGNVFQEIRQALMENNARNRANDNFLAAANHLIGAANAERQNLTALIASQREENEKLLSHFANQITLEIRGQKHSFVDAMEKATALNVEGQLRELKTQISSQLVEMAKGVERLSEERKVLEQQISELLAFKSRFTPPDYSDMPSVYPGEHMPQVVPRSSRQRLQIDHTAQAQRPHQSTNLQQHSGGNGRSPSPAPVSKRPLPSPNQLHPMHNQTPLMGQRF